MALVLSVVPVRPYAATAIARVPAELHGAPAPLPPRQIVPLLRMVAGHIFPLLAGHGADHVVPLLAAPSLTVPVIGGRLALGTWQSICLLDPNPDNATRTVRLGFLAG